MRYFELCEKSDALALELMSTNEFKELLELKEKINNSIPDLLQNFQKAKEKYEEVSKYSSYHPDLKKTRLELVAAKEALYTNELVVRYKELERIIQQKLNEVATIIAQSIKTNSEEV